jgi:hypothetical protein
MRRALLLRSQERRLAHVSRREDLGEYTPHECGAAAFRYVAGVVLEGDPAGGVRAREVESAAAWTVEAKQCRIRPTAGVDDGASDLSAFAGRRLALDRDRQMGLIGLGAPDPDNATRPILSGHRGSRKEANYHHGSGEPCDLGVHIRLFSLVRYWK